MTYKNKAMYPHTITVINEYNYRGDITYYFKTLEGVHYQDKQAERTGTTEHFTNNNGYIQIPHELEGYLPPNEWKDSDKSKFWTLKEHDKVVKGVVSTTDIDEIEGIRTIESIENVDYSFILPKHYGVTLK